ncbi:MAG: DegT/DnrJ/EryC1/StrS family aminotransferase, partial [Acidaminococcales bacterium]|jgi:dTDP-4-amino-4,6-dideoxygalactose transaminase|nr:DegT/DnrJ/EryC1/StrS family aminotransferase [Acidaminococcales bacterium]
VLEIEDAFAKRFKAKYAVSFNSATTALHAAVAACGIGPGDEVMTSPYTMSATASSILMNNAVPVFLDIDEKTYNIRPEEIEKWLSPHSKAVLTVNIFGLPSDLGKIKEMAKKHGLWLIEDHAQAPGSGIGGNESPFGDLRVFSLNYHKIVHSGEGGVILTDNEELAYRCRLVRNHGEVVLDDTGDAERVALGSNYRMTELHAAIGIEQLKKLDGFLKCRRNLAARLSAGLRGFPGISDVYVPEGFSHAYYVYPFNFDKAAWGISRHTFAQAVAAEGMPLAEGYVKPIYLMNIYRHKKVYNNTEYPFAFIPKPTQEYKKGLCPVTEKLQYEILLTADTCRIPFSEENIDEFLLAVGKAWENRDALAAYEKARPPGV